MFLGSPEKNSKASNQYDALFEKKNHVEITLIKSVIT